MDVESKYSLVIPVRPKNPQGFRGSCRGAWVGVFGHPESTQVDEGGERKSEVRADLYYDRRIRLRFQGLARATEFLGAVMSLFVAFITIWRRVVAFRAGEFSLRFNGAWKPYCRQAGTRRTRWFLDLTRLTLLGGAVGMWICYSHRAPRRLGSFRSGKNSA